MRSFLALLLFLVVASSAWADMYPDASNAKLPVARTNLGLGTMATQGADAVAITGGTASGLTSLGLSGPLTGSMTASGNISASTPVNLITIASDSVTSGTGGLNAPNLYGFLVEHICCAAAATNATRYALASEMLVSGTPAAGSTNNSYVAHFAYAVANSAGGAGALLEGGNDNVLLQAGATGWTSLVGREIDVTSLVPLTVKVGLSFVQSQNDTSQGSTLDAAIMLDNQAGAVGWKNVILLDLLRNPLNANACLWCTVRGTATVTTGIDWSSITFTGNSLKVNGFQVAGNGLLVQTGIGAGQDNLTINGGASGANGGGCLVVSNAGSPQFLFGNSSACLGGAFSSAGVINTGGNSLLVTSANFKVTATGMGSVLPVSAGTGGLFVCTDATGVFYKKATCP